MKTHALYPLTFHPLYRDDSWGGQRIAQRFNRANTPTPCSESVEISGLEGMESIVAYGPFEGIGLGTLAQTFGRDLTGSKAPNPEVFPLLIKLLDTRSAPPPLVLPEGSPALLYLIDALPRATLSAGLAPNAPSTNLQNHLIAHPTRPGDLFPLPAGLLHGLGAGNLIYAVRRTDQPNVCLYPSPEATKALKRNASVTPLPAPERSARSLLPRWSSPEFSFATLHLQRPRSIGTTEHSCMLIFCAAGKTTLEHHGPRPLTLLPGDSVLLPPNQLATFQPLAPSLLLLTTL